ncbi:MAG: HAD-IC family P-type ATPase [Ferruginibacter sp.]
MEITYPYDDPHAQDAAEVLKAFQTNADTGLSQSEADNRTKKFGANVFEAQKQKSVWLMLLLQFKSPIVYLLVFGTIVSFYFKDYIEAIAIVAVILINALIGFFMELQARSSMKALKEMDVIHSKVIRDGKTIDIPSEKLTPGDIVMLEAGDVIPADGRLLESNQLQCDESSLTGESLPSEKNTEKLEKDTGLADQLNMVFKGSSVMDGKGKALITGIAKKTQLGAITSLVADSGETTTPLDRKLSVLSKKLIWLTLCLIGIFAVTGFIRGEEWVSVIKTSIALAVAAFPEGLPIVATVALAHGMLLMARRNALVKKLSSVETLGSTNVILTDKTGTLTENKIFVDTFSFAEAKLKVRIKDKSLEIENGDTEKVKKEIELLTLVGALCNNASAKPKDDKKKLSGDPIETALITLANASGKPVEELIQQYPRVAEIPFSSETKMMGTLHKSPTGQFAAAKGSVEHLLENCSKMQSGETISDLSSDIKKNILSESEQMAAEGLRVLAFAYRDDDGLTKENFLDELTYVGMIGFLDPPGWILKRPLHHAEREGYGS